MSGFAITPSFANVQSTTGGGHSALHDIISAATTTLNNVLAYRAQRDLVKYNANVGALPGYQPNNYVNPPTQTIVEKAENASQIMLWVAVAILGAVVVALMWKRLG